MSQELMESLRNLSLLNGKRIVVQIEGMEELTEAIAAIAHSIRSLQDSVRSDHPLQGPEGVEAVQAVAQALQNIADSVEPK